MVERPIVYVSQRDRRDDFWWTKPQKERLCKNSQVVRELVSFIHSESKPLVAKDVADALLELVRPAARADSYVQKIFDEIAIEWTTFERERRASVATNELRENLVFCCENNDETGENFFAKASRSEIEERYTGLAQMCASHSTRTPEAGLVGGMVLLSYVEDCTPCTFGEAVALMAGHRSVDSAEAAPLVNLRLQIFYDTHAQEIERAIATSRPFVTDYFGAQTLLRSYLARSSDRSSGGHVFFERPEYMYMRAALGLHLEDYNLQMALHTFERLVRGEISVASPILFNSGTPHPQLASCFLVSAADDSIEGIYDTLKECACISKGAGGVGLHVSKIRSKGSHIRGTNGQSNGIVPMLRNFNATAHYVDQGGGRRPGAICVFLDIWHGDVRDFISLGLPGGDEHSRAHDLTFGLMVPDLFMRRVRDDEDWHLFDPKVTPKLLTAVGELFDAAYAEYEDGNVPRQTIKARALWADILANIQHGATISIVFADAANLKSNQKNLGAIKSSNLCLEILEFSSAEETAVCNLASLPLPSFLRGDEAGGSCADGSRAFDFDELRAAAADAVRLLNRAIDATRYPNEKACRSNLRHRPIAIGVQGLHDVFTALAMPFDSAAAMDLNAKIFETIAFGALSESAEMAVESGPYASFEGSPLARGELQSDLWKMYTPDLLSKTRPPSGTMPHGDRYDWDALRAKIKATGARNSLLTGVMPTASTAQILRNSEGIEARVSNMFTRRVNAGEFPVVNERLVRDLSNLGMWTDETRQRIVAANGSVQNLDLSDELKAVYKTAWEIKQRVVIDMCADRGRFIDQTQSMNIYLEDPTAVKMDALMFHAWRRGLKTGLYYLRMRAATDAVKFTVDPDIASASASPSTPPAKPLACALGCDSCGA